MTLDEWAFDAVAAEIPFRRKGRGRDGIDCWGLVVLLYSEVYDITLPDYSDLYEPGDVYKADKILELVENRLDTWDLVEKGEEQPGDGIWICGNGVSPHVAVVVRPGTMIHIEDGILVSVVDYRNAIWESSIREFRRHRSRSRQPEPI